MRQFKGLLAIAVGLCAVSLLVANARYDLRIDSERDKERNTTYYLKNTGDRTIEAKISMLKDCTGNRKPTVRTFWVPPKGKVKLARAGANSSCRHDYRVKEAVYH